jgi:hypothetical protein
MVIQFKKQIKALIEIEAQKIRTWAVKANNGSKNMTNWCVTCSYLIFKKLSKLNLEPEFCTVSFWGGSHAFIYCHGFIVDVTSTQFDRMRKKVVVMENDGIHKKAFWNLAFAERFKTIEAVEEHLKLWSPECNPRTKFRFQKCC